MSFKSLFLPLALLSTAFAEKPNILLICVDDLRPELKSFGANYIHSPAMDSLVASGRAFTRHYVQAPTCGASRYVLLTGKYGVVQGLRGNNALASVAKDADKQPHSMPRHFRENGYRTVSIGKVSHYPGGLGGKGWSDPEKPEMPGAWDISLMPTDPWENPEVAMHSYAGGKGRERGVTPVNEHVDGDDLTYTDGWITRESLKQMEELSGKDEPFFLAVGLMKPHLPFACPKKYLDLYEGVELPPISHPEKPEGLTTWHSSGEFFGRYFHADRDPRTDPAYADEIRRSYAACVSYADAQVAQLLERLEKLGLEENTIVILWGDHGYHLGEHSIYGKHSLFEESLLAPLVIRAPGMKQSGISSSSITETADIYPTLCELTGVPQPAGLSGESLVANLSDPAAPGRPAISYAGKRETIRTDTHRLIRHHLKDRTAFELYDHTGSDGEITNLAGEKPELVQELNALLDERMK
ncbi:MAG: sulfatase [Akkermansiaceae bacterium]|jgi:iduronate 2-sulfatase|nr:sulfatase [Akkermansiaceae bacterium]MDP4646023.1 sulfatase [Akkermansiaceae bacterium]MDP4721998.1 sulfatase [Akkermansiaceae bacterium]MDP4780819.1 sulfatase [Akkermansiaceae bacterium]MDP4847846.1 sulfatase [Akkermansiaceae bacterium]